MEQENQQTLPHGYVLQGEKNRYVIDRVLGQGSFGITYLAKFKVQLEGSMGRGSVQSTVAIKEFFMRDLNVRDGSTGYLNDASQDSLIGKYRRAFVREARNLARLSHPGIVNVFEVIETNNTVYIVMEYIDGGSLDGYISSRGSMPENEALSLFRGICSAVGFMHQHRMLHLDLKPKNIMLDEERHPLLIDFGLSKQYTEDGEPESSTSIGLGTPGYAPIEQAERTDNDTSFRPTIDIYALGGTLYKMLTGNTPPLASKVSESALEGENLIATTLKEQGISDATTALVTKAMWPASKRRYQNTSEMVAAIDEILQEHGIGNAGGKPAGGIKGNINNTDDEDEETVVVGQSRTSSSPSTGTNNGHNWVDLGLSVKWATCNIGASSPSAYGDYYAWGETSTKSRYAWENYLFRTSGDEWENGKFNKYNTQSKRGTVDNRTVLEMSDDVARQKWGGSWRMPTEKEFQELRDNCTWTWTTMDGVKGYKVTSKKSGYKDRSIFLPAAGCRVETSLLAAGEWGEYWSSSLNVSPLLACIIEFNSGNRRTYFYYRAYGLSVRPVCP